jgi:predicted RNA-binding Zn-ribbon protein involved in translation (DUF1610 family)
MVMNRERRETTKEVTRVSISQDWNDPISISIPDKTVYVYPDPPMKAPEPSDCAEPCPYCDMFLSKPENFTYDAWFQCPNCGEIFFARKESGDWWNPKTAEATKRIWNLDAPETADMAVLSPVNESYGIEATQYKMISLALAAVQEETLKAGNYGAKAGETIAGNLKRGGDGKFTSGGSSAFGGLGTDKTSLDEVKRRVEALRAPKAKGGGKKKAAGKKGAAKKAPKGKKAKPTKEEKDAAKLAAQGKNLEATLGADLTEAITAVQDDPETSVNEPYRTQLLTAGLIQENPGGTTTLSGAGRSLMNAAANDNQNGIKQALNRGKVAAKAGAAKTAASNQKKADRAAELRAKADKLDSTTKEIATISEQVGSLAVFKSLDGRWRWVAFTSSSFEDGDGETVTQKAIETDVERADRDGDYGPLRWFHVPGFDIGDCDFNMVVGRILVESGTFRNDFIAEKMAAAAPYLELSAGFYRSPLEPINGVYHNFRRFERSLLPAGIASNALTGLFVNGD